MDGSLSDEDVELDDMSVPAAAPTTNADVAAADAIPPPSFSLSNLAPADTQKLRIVRILLYFVYLIFAIFFMFVIAGFYAEGVREEKSAFTALGAATTVAFVLSFVTLFLGNFSYFRQRWLLGPIAIFVLLNAATLVVFFAVAWKDYAQKCEEHQRYEDRVSPVFYEVDCDNNMEIRAMFVQWGFGIFAQLVTAYVLFIYTCGAEKRLFGSYVSAFEMNDASYFPDNEEVAAHATTQNERLFRLAVWVVVSFLAVGAVLLPLFFIFQPHGGLRSGFCPVDHGHFEAAPHVADLQCCKMFNAASCVKPGADTCALRFPYGDHIDVFRFNQFALNASELSQLHVRAAHECRRLANMVGCAPFSPDAGHIISWNKTNSVRVCRKFCDQIWEHCRLASSHGRPLAEAYTTSTGFCQKEFNFTVVESHDTMLPCFQGSAANPPWRATPLALALVALGTVFILA